MTVLSTSTDKLAAQTIAEMLGVFAAEGTFGEVGNFMMGKDEHFHFGDWVRVFRTVPSLRKYLIPALLWNLITPGRSRNGFSETYIPGRKYNFRYRSFCTDFLLWESIGRAARHFGIPIHADVKKNLAAYVGLAFENCYRVPYQQAALRMFSYYPRKDHLVPPGSAVHKLFFSQDDNVPDNDTTGIVLGSIISLLELFELPTQVYRHDESETLLFLDLLEQHVHGEGRYGRKSLSYLNGILAGDTGVMTWVFDDHNELDPTSNINILNYLILLKRICPGADATRVAGLTARIFRFLANHVHDGSFLDQRFQSYYPLGPTFFFWQRFARNFHALTEAERSVLDPESRFALIDDFLLEKGTWIFRDRKMPFNPYDLLASASFLYERGAAIRELSLWLAAEDGGLAHFRETHYEIFHLRYPSKILCAPLMHPHACLLDLLTIVDKRPS